MRSQPFLVHLTSVEICDICYLSPTVTLLPPIHRSKKSEGSVTWSVGNPNCGEIPKPDLTSSWLVTEHWEQFEPNHYNPPNWHFFRRSQDHMFFTGRPPNQILARMLSEQLARMSDHREERGKLTLWDNTIFAMRVPCVVVALEILVLYYSEHWVSFSSPSPFQPGNDAVLL